MVLSRSTYPFYVSRSDQSDTFPFFTIKILSYEGVLVALEHLSLCILNIFLGAELGDEFKAGFGALSIWS